MKENIIKTIDKILNDKEVELINLKRGRKFLISLKEDNSELTKIVSEFRIEIDKNKFISGNDLIPLTISILNKEEDVPGEETYVGGKITSFRIHYLGLSPELENFVVLVLWPEYSQHSKKALEEIWMKIKNSKKRDIILKIEGNYKIRLPNEIHPFRAENIVAEERKLHDWKYIPYLKEVGDTIFSHVSPLNFRKAYIRSLQGDYKKKYVNLKTCVGLIKKIYGGHIKIKLPYFDHKNIKGYYNVRYYHHLQDKVKMLKSGDKIAFLIFEEIDRKIEQKYFPTHVIYDIEKVNSAYIIGHILSYILYNYYLLQKRLLVSSYEEYKKLFDYVVNMIGRYCKYILDVNEQILTEEVTLFAYLRPFFQKINDEIFYVPAFLKNDHQKILYFDEKLKENDNKLFDKPCLHENWKIVEYDKDSNLIYCPTYNGKIRDGSDLCEQCEYYHLHEKNITLQNRYNFLRFILKISSLLYRDRLKHFDLLCSNLPI